MALVMAIGAAPVVAQQRNNCAPRESVIDRLADGFGETRQSVGLGANNVVVETFASSETGTWTITVTMPTGLTCLVASGQAFETASVALPAPAPDL
jgi:hypothetical protein